MDAVFSSEACGSVCHGVFIKGRETDLKGITLGILNVVIMKLGILVIIEVDHNIVCIL